MIKKPNQQREDAASEQEKSKKANIFETADLDLGAFLMLHGLKFLGSRVEDDLSKQKPKAIMRFLDDRQNARDLERIFMTSSEKRFRDLNKYLLREAHRIIKEVKYYGNQ